MTTYLARRFLQAAIIMAGLTVFFFAILHAEPGGPCAHILATPNPNSEAEYHHCLVSRGLDQPVPVQYWRWLSATVHGDFDIDYTGRPVIETMKLRLPATIMLVGIAYIFQELIALPIGLLGALKRYSIYDQVLTFLSYIGLSLPTFWLGLMLILLLAVKLPLFPPGGIVNGSLPIPPFGTGDYWTYLVGHPAQTIGDFLWHLALPGLTLAIIGIGGDSRFMRASMLDVINQDFVRTARAKGLSRFKVVMKHALRNAMLPIITNWGLYIPTLVSGAIITESIFGWPGMGKYFVDALGNHDNNTLQAILLLSALMVLVGNLVADLLYAWTDPRIRYD